YFNAIFAVLIAIVWRVTGIEALLVLVPIQLLEMLHQLLPLVRLDGYHILADLVGVPDLFGRIKPTLLALVPGGRKGDNVRALKPWARVCITAWILLVVRFLALLLS